MHFPSSEKKIACALFVLLLLLFLGSLLAIQYHSRLTASKDKGCIADIYQNGSLIESISLEQVEAPYTITLTGDAGGTNIIEVRKGSIGITYADCPDKLCVKQGFIDSSLLPITCLPNRVVIVLRSVEEKEDIYAY